MSRVPEQEIEPGEPIVVDDEADEVSQDAEAVEQVMTTEEVGEESLGSEGDAEVAEGEIVEGDEAGGEDAGLGGEPDDVADAEEVMAAEDEPASECESVEAAEAAEETGLVEEIDEAEEVEEVEVFEAVAVASLIEDAEITEAVVVEDSAIAEPAPQPIPEQTQAIQPAPLPPIAEPAYPTPPRVQPQPTRLPPTQPPLPPANLPERLVCLETLIDATEDRISEATATEIRTIAGHVRSRLALSPDHVIAVFAGATGSGKSSLFNSLLRFELSPIGPIRPTTLTSMACIWDPDRAPGAWPLLDRIGVEERFRTLRGSLLDGARRQAEPELAPLVLVDLPDHDSAIRSHREETDRATALADLLLFVTDPQKYADASWHDRYLKNLTHHQEALAVILNKADELSPADARACAQDCRRLLTEAGLGDVPLIVTSTLTGEGLAELRSLIANRVWRKEAALQRSAADLYRAGTLVADELRAQGEAPTMPQEAYDAALTRISDGTGMDALADLVETTYRRRASAVTGWPLRHAIAALRSRERSEDGSYLPWTAPEASEPTPPPVQRGDVEAAVGQMVADAAKPLPAPWARRTQGIADTCIRQLADTLDATLGGTEVGPRLIPRWWTAVQVLHWMLLTATLVGFSGTIVLGLTGDTTSLPKTGIPFPALIAVLALGLGAVLDVASQVAARRAATRLRQRVLDRMTERVRAAVEQLLFAPLKAERDRYLKALALAEELKG